MGTCIVRKPCVQVSFPCAKRFFILSAEATIYTWEDNDEKYYKCLRLEACCQVLKTSFREQFRNKCCLELMVQKVLAEWRVVTTETKNHIHFTEFSPEITVTHN